MHLSQSALGCAKTATVLAPAGHITVVVIPIGIGDLVIVRVGHDYRGDGMLMAVIVIGVGLVGPARHRGGLGLVQSGVGQEADARQTA